MIPRVKRGITEKTSVATRIFKRNILSNFVFTTILSERFVTRPIHSNYGVTSPKRPVQLTSFALRLCNHGAETFSKASPIFLISFSIWIGLRR